MPHELQRPLRILVCDDEADIRDMFAALLELRGHEVHLAATGAEALAVMRQHPIGVALIDVGLPDFSGYEVVKRATAEHGGCAPQFIAVTGFGQGADKARAADAGFVRHLVKPATAAMLFHAIDSVL